ncbi:hypothetical protein F441_04888 [Phytophthora nicotianae CJ01A1]|nr:hypothetical protein F441_04888 [Phytophthora nicotianae CJ01A1]
MARQLTVVRRSLRRDVLLRQAWPSVGQTCRLFSSVSSLNVSTYDVSSLPGSPNIVHHSLVTTVPNLQALQRMRWLLQQPQRRVLLLTGSSSDSPVRVALEQDSPAFELERRGHGVFGVREFSQLLLRESGRERRIFDHAQLAALLLHNGMELPGASRLAASSTLQRRKGVLDLLQLFRLLEREGVTPEQYATVAIASGEQAPQELAETYRKYQELLMQHNATSWDGLVMDALELCGVQKGSVVEQEATTNDFSREVLKEYTDVVVDDVQRMTPAMATLVGHLCGQPSVQSSASFSRVLLDGDECPQTRILEQQILKTASCTGRERSVARLALETDEMADKRAKMKAFAKQILTQEADIATPAPIPLKCWNFGTSEAEERSVGAFLAQKLQSDKTTQATVLCPTHADANRITLAFKKQGLPVQMIGDQFAAATSSTGAPVHLFDEPGVNAVYSLLCALCFPSDSRHLYNVLRSDYFAFPAELLSWLMEKEHRSHVDLFPVLEAFVQSQGKSLGTSLNYREGEELELPKPVSSQLEKGLEIAESFVNIINRLRAECHQLSAAEIVQSFLEDTGRLDALLKPSSPEQERESLALADFLRELETAQNVVKSDQVTFVAPYLQQLRETNLTSSVSLEDAPDVLSPSSTDRDTGIRVLPLTSYALELLAASMTDRKDDRKHVLVLMSMRDSKFPGRMKRLTLPLPYELLSKPYPVQTRTEHLKQCKQLAYQSLTLGDYSEVVLSFAELAASSSSKREMLSRTFQPIWHDGDRPPVSTGKGSNKGRTGARNATSSTSSPQLSWPQHSPTNRSTPNEKAAVVNETPHFRLSDVAGLLREFVNRVFLPILHYDKRIAAAGASPETGRDDGHATSSLRKQNAKEAKQGTSRASSVDSDRSPVSATSASYEPSHLSYSQISEYLRCPHRYYLGRIMKLDGDVSASMMFGRALHEGIAAFAKSLSTTQVNGEVTQEMETHAASEAEETFMRAWVGDGYGLFTSKEQASFLLERGMMALWEFIETHYGDVQLKEIVHVEKDFSFHVPEANVELRGVWDRIDRVSSRTGDGSSSFVIKEFKSNMGGAERNMRKLADDSLQLKMYMYAFRKVFGEAPYGAKLQQIGGNYNEASKPSRRRISRAGNDDNGFVHFSEEAAQEAVDAIVEVALGLRRGDFEPKPSFVECAFCPYAGSACHFATDDASHERQSARRAGEAAQR